MNRQQKKATFHFDPWLSILVLALMAFGLLMVASASMVISDRIYGYPFHYLIRQGIFMLIGLALLVLVTRIPLKVWQQYSSVLLLVGMGLLLAVLIPGIGHVVNGSRRWINFGLISLQVSEVIKFSAILYLCSYLQRYQNQVRTEIIGFVKPMLVLALIGALLLLEPDFGAATVIAMTFLALLFIAGARLGPFSILFTVVVAGMVILAVTSPYRLERLTTFMHPWSSPFGSGYQLTQSLIAFGRGGIFGVGLGNSVQKLFYLPEAHTDFIFAVVAEEMGLVGLLLLMALFIALVARIFYIGRIAQHAENSFAAYVCYGFGLWIALQMMINIGVNTGVLPTKGLTLPFISYGGSSLLVNCVVMGLLLRVAFESRFSTKHAQTDYQFARTRF